MKHIRSIYKQEMHVKCGARDPLVPLTPCESGTPLSGLKGNGRTMETSKAECENILENEREGTLHGGLKQGKTKYSCTALERFIYVLIGSLVCVIVSVTTVKIMRLRKQLKYDKQDRQGKAAFNERNPTRPSYKSQWQGAQEDPKQKQDRAQGREHGQANY
ncbi:uncharacterized protein LOC132728268 [Ruditapes philippinarum]|uniref:uncharacterized protein LOC132728268 n=1 Tax=Ruditapes philippinarum TaxID=129788 RepID=UPI00295B1ED0|nr:uncharacterized protein LOC132728268 [Ruditapes philippinarum]